jgi:hypothetical protein
MNPSEDTQNAPQVRPGSGQDADAMPADPAEEDARRVQVGPDAALAEEGGQEVTVAHVHGTEKSGEPWRHGAYVLLGGGLDGRRRLERAVRRLCEVLAHDQGYDSFDALPATRRGLVRRYSEMDVAASAMWASGVVTGRLADRWLDLVNAQRRLGEALGLQRTIKDAQSMTLEEIRAQYDGQEAKR